MTIVCTKAKVQDVPFFWRSLFTKGAEFVYLEIDTKYISDSPFSSDFKPLRFVLPESFTRIADRYYNFDVRFDDIFITSFPKSGTTWMQNIVQYLNNKLDFSVPLVTPFEPFLDDAAIGDVNPSIEKINRQVSPRMIKTHLPAHLLPKQIWSVKPKIIYVARNPMDVAVSMYYMCRAQFSDFSYTCDEYVESFLDNIEVHFHHVSEYWHLHHLDFVLFMTYEELSTNRFDCIKRISEFLGHSYNDNQLQQISEFVSFQSMKQKLRVPDETNTQLRFK